MSEENVNTRRLKVCYFGTYRADYTRNQILLKGLRSQPGVTVFECHSTLWQGIDDRVKQASGGWTNPLFIWRAIKAYWRLFRRHNKTPDYDVMLIGYPGQFDAYLGRLLSRWRRKPMALDILMSLYLVAEERGLTVKSPRTARLLFALERGGLKRPDRLIAENAEYEEYIRGNYDLPRERFRHLSHGADESIYFPRPAEPPSKPFRVCYHGTYLPSHGLDVVIGAIETLHGQPGIEFHFYGEGPGLAGLQAHAQELGLKNITFHGFVSRDMLLEGIASSHLCLGVFGSTRQAMFTIQNKLWEGLAMARPVISGDSPTVRETLEHKKHIYLVQRTSQDLADGILTLKNDPVLLQDLGSEGHKRFLSGNSTQAIGARLADILGDLVGR